MTPLEINKKILQLKGWKFVDEIGASLIVEIPYSGAPNELFDWSQTKWTQDIGHAWDLFESLPHQALIKKPDGAYECCYFSNGELHRLFAETAPLAICLAWINWKTLGEERK